MFCRHIGCIYICQNLLIDLKINHYFIVFFISHIYMGGHNTIFVRFVPSVCGQTDIQTYILKNKTKKLVDMIQATKDQDAMGRGLLCTCLRIYLKHVHRHVCDIEMGKMSVSVMITASPDSLTMLMHGSNQMLHSMWNVLPLVLQCRKK